jgi:hypothetical protein
MQAILKLEKLDQDFKVLEQVVKPSRSFTLGLIQLLYILHAQIQSGSPYAALDIDGTSRNLIIQQWAASGQAHLSLGCLKMGCGGGQTCENCWSMAAGGSFGTGQNVNMYIESQKLGVVIGTGSTAVAPTNNSLVTRIAHGRSAGQMEYGGCELVNLAISNPNASLDIRRYFTNNSGGSITVQECGLYAAGTIDAASFPFCVARDLTGGVAVGNTEILRVTYTLQITV